MIIFYTIHSDGCNASDPLSLVVLTQAVDNGMPDHIFKFDNFNARSFIFALIIQLFFSTIWLKWLKKFYFKKMGFKTRYQTNTNIICHLNHTFKFDNFQMRRSE